MADYFVTRGYQHFAFCGAPGVYYSELRSKHFGKYLKRMGHELFVYIVLTWYVIVDAARRVLDSGRGHAGEARRARTALSRPGRLSLKTFLTRKGVD